MTVTDTAIALAERTGAGTTVHRRHLLAAAVLADDVRADDAVAALVGVSWEELVEFTCAAIGATFPAEAADWQAIAAAARAGDLDLRSRTLPDPEPDLSSGRTALIRDVPTTQDALGRLSYAQEVAGLIRELSSTEHGKEAFALHLDAPWGAGKSTLVGFVRDELTKKPAPTAGGPAAERWTVVELDAWRASQLSPAWWALLATLKRGVRGSLGPMGRLRLSAALAAQAARRLWKIWVPPLVVLVILGGLWIQSVDISATMAVATAVVGFALATGGLGSRFLSLGSLQGARIHERIDDNPMEAVMAQIGLLRAASPHPVLLVLDDLDRCNQRFAVELLDSVQTLLRSDQRPVRARRGAATTLGTLDARASMTTDTDGRRTTSSDVKLETRTTHDQDALPTLVVLAVGDGRWLRAAYEHEYAVFAPFVAEPGRPLGHLFLDKLFQLRLELPQLSPAQVSDYVAGLLHLAPQRGAEAQRERELDERMRSAPREAGDGSTSLDERVAEILSQAEGMAPQTRQRLAAAALDVRRDDPLRVARQRHLLEEYTSLLEPNPRAAKRFLMAYNLAFAARVCELEPVDPRTLALWTVVATRWPTLAEWVRGRLPDLDIGPEGEPDHVSHLLDDPHVQAVLNSTLGGPLDRAMVMRCCGLAASGGAGSSAAGAAHR
ncbi:MAG: P-loop NTPase fold protein [Brevundimonas sp.]|nr:P-loop NTPase fold protein [Pseudomonadota bacterium]